MADRVFRRTILHTISSRAQREGKYVCIPLLLGMGIRMGIGMGIGMGMVYSPLGIGMGMGMVYVGTYNYLHKYTGVYR